MLGDRGRWISKSSCQPHSEFQANKRYTVETLSWGPGEEGVPISISEDDEAGVPSGLFFKYQLFKCAVLDKET